MVKNTQYTPHLAEVSFETQYPEWSDFGIPRNGHIYVSQGRGEISSDGTPLHSGGFSFCSGLILKNTQTLETALFHMDDIDLTFKQTAVVNELVRNFVQSLDTDPEEKEKLTELVAAAARYWNPKSFNDRCYNEEERQYLKDRMTELNQDDVIRACYVLGDVSRNNRFRMTDQLFDGLGIKITDEIRVYTDKMHWSLAYKPKESKVLVESRKQKKVLIYSF